MSPEHEKLFALLCVIGRVAGHAHGHNGRQILWRIHRIAVGGLATLGAKARVTLRVRTALEEIVEHTSKYQIIDNPEYVAAQVLKAVAWGAGKSKLLTSVTDHTWREQCAGRATLTLRRDFPELVNY